MHSIADPQKIRRKCRLELRDDIPEWRKPFVFKEKQEALNAWGARLAKIVSGLELVKAENGEL
jgi:hypothetical protein